MNLVVSGLTGLCGPGYSCSWWNGNFTLTRCGCGWDSGVYPGWTLFCSGQTWEIYTYGIAVCARFTAPNTSGCPPASGWTKDPNTTCSDGSISLSW
jgi:hypothetical protein